MRIIAGSKVRMTLLSPLDINTRPITDRVKESLFNILRNELPHALVADLFCGTGSLGLEALSRGANRVIFADRDVENIRLLRENIAKLGFEPQCVAVRCDVLKTAVPCVVSKSNLFTLIFVDPPYKLTRDTQLDSNLGQLLAKLADQLADEGLVVVRHEKRSELLQQYATLNFQQRRQYGKMAITFLEKKSGQ